MATDVLLINRDDIMRLTSLRGNIDEDKILPHVKTAQDIHLQTILGTALLDKCKDDVDNDTLTGNYKVLVEEYITPVLVFYCMVDFLPFLSFEIANGGVYQHQAEGSIAPDISIINRLDQKFKDRAEFYGRRLADYLCDKGSATFPEINDTSGSNMPSDTDETFHGWVF